jgi:hypothetical protein
MKADLSRATFDKARRYRSVRMQQGRVQLDADFNEQQDILNHRIEIETRDSLGPVAVPIDNPGFGLTPAGTDLTISAGRLYVDGLLCENPATTPPSPTSPICPTPPRRSCRPVLRSCRCRPSALRRPASPASSSSTPATPWRRPKAPTSPISKPGSATSARSICRWTTPACAKWRSAAPTPAPVKKPSGRSSCCAPAILGAALDCLSNIAAWNTLTAAPDGRLAARAEASIPPKTPCQLPPEAGYRLLENHLYRVEIHDDGSVAGKARYKWSRDNGSLLSRVVRWLDDPIANEFEVASIGRDDVLAITAGCWVEFYDDTHELLGQPGPLVPVIRTEGNVVTVDLTKLIGHALDQAMFPRNPRVRRWDGVAEIRPAAIANPNTGWEELAQDGIELKFAPGSYRIGDYWLIPARTATAAIEWPQENGKPAFLAPAGVLRAFARLALLEFKAGAWTLKSDCRPLIPQPDRTDPAPLRRRRRPEHQQPIHRPTPQPCWSNAAEPAAGRRQQWPVSGRQRPGALYGGCGQLPNGSKLWKWYRPTLADGTAAIDLVAGLGSQANPFSMPPLNYSSCRSSCYAGRYLPVQFTAQLALASGSRLRPQPAALSCWPPTPITVQQAIDTLCKRTQGGGCCVTVGLAGEFETLDAWLCAS